MPSRESCSTSLQRATEVLLTVIFKGQAYFFRHPLAKGVCSGDRAGDQEHGLSSTSGIRERKAAAAASTRHRYNSTQATRTTLAGFLPAKVERERCNNKCRAYTVRLTRFFKPLQRRKVAYSLFRRKVLLLHVPAVESATAWTHRKA